MSGFSADWLHLREPFDHAARQAAFDAFALPRQARHWRGQGASEALSVVDLACGTGSHLRALAPRLGGAQRWRLVDHDPTLLAAAPEALADWARRHGYAHHAREPDASGNYRLGIAGPGFSANVTLQALDLARDLRRLDLADTPLVTASALLDLVSTPWLTALVRQARDARCPMLFALTVDGLTTWSPPDPHDATIDTLFSAHQQRDKGFGPALGSRAVPLALRLMADAGYAVAQAPSDWIIDARDAYADRSCDPLAMLTAMVEGMAHAALEQAQATTDSGASAAEAFALWQARRRAALHATQLRVGHVDLFATLPGPQATAGS